MVNASPACTTKCVLTPDSSFVFRQQSAGVRQQDAGVRQLHLLVQQQHSIGRHDWPGMSSRHDGVAHKSLV